MALIVAQLQAQNDLIRQQLQQQGNAQQQMEQRMVEMMQATVETQRAQTQAQIDALSDLGTAQMAKAAADSNEKHTKAFSKVKVFKGDALTWADWRYKFRVEASKSFKDAKAILDWVEQHHDHPILAPDVGTAAAHHGWRDMESLSMQLHGDLVALMEEGSEGFEIVRNSSEEVGLDAWRRLNYRFDPTSPLRNLQMLEKLIAPPQVGFGEVVKAVEKWEQQMRICKSRCGDSIEELWKQIHMVCIQKMCPKALKDHLAVQASVIDSPEKQKVAIDKFLQATSVGSGATAMDVDALAKTKGGDRGKKGAGKGDQSQSEKFEGECRWCKKKGHK